MTVKVIETRGDYNIPEKEHAKNLEKYLKEVNKKLDEIKITTTYKKYDGTIYSGYKLISVVIFE